MPTVKTAISLPGPLFDSVDAVARDLHLARSQVVALALEEFLERHRSRQLLTQLNEVYAGEADDDDRVLLESWRHRHRELLADEG